MCGGSAFGVPPTFTIFLFCFVCLKNDRLLNLYGFAVVLLVFGRSGGVLGGVPHLKTGRSARVAVSPPISTKKININFGCGSCVGVRVGLVGEGFDVKAKLSWLIR